MSTITTRPVVRFADGATASLSGASTLPKGQPVQIDLRIFGSEGMLVLDIERERLELRRRDGKDEVIGPGSRRRRLFLRRAAQRAGRPLPRPADRQRRPRPGRPTGHRGAGRDVPLGGERTDGGGVSKDLRNGGLDRLTVRGHRQTRILDALGRADDPALPLHLPRRRGAVAGVANERGGPSRGCCRHRSSRPATWWWRISTG